MIATIQAANGVFDAISKLFSEHIVESTELTQSMWFQRQIRKGSAFSLPIQNLPFIWGKISIILELIITLFECFFAEYNPPKTFLGWVILYLKAIRYAAQP